MEECDTGFDKIKWRNEKSEFRIIRPDESIGGYVSNLELKKGTSWSGLNNIVCFSNNYSAASIWQTLGGEVYELEQPLRLDDIDYKFVVYMLSSGDLINRKHVFNRHTPFYGTKTLSNRDICWGFYNFICKFTNYMYFNWWGGYKRYGDLSDIDFPPVLPFGTGSGNINTNDMFSFGYISLVATYDLLRKFSSLSETNRTAVKFNERIKTYLLGLAFDINREDFENSQFKLFDGDMWYKFNPEADYRRNPESVFSLIGGPGTYRNFGGRGGGRMLFGAVSSIYTLISTLIPHFEGFRCEDVDIEFTGNSGDIGLNYMDVFDAIRDKYQIDYQVANPEEGSSVEKKATSEEIQEWQEREKWFD